MSWLLSSAMQASGQSAQYNDAVNLTQNNEHMDTGSKMATMMAMAKNNPEIYNRAKDTYLTSDF